MSQSGLKDNLDENRLHVFNIKKAHVIIVLLGSIITPLLTGITAYHKSLASIGDEFHNIRLESERSFVKKDDFKSLNEKIDRIADDVAEIRGYMKRRR